MSKFTRKRVAIDIDFTIADLATPMIAMHNEINSTNYKPEDATDWKWTSIKMADGEFTRIYVRTWIDNAHKIGLLVDPKLLRAAEKYYHIEFLSSRGGHPLLESTVEPLRRWLGHHGLADIKLVISPARVEKTELDYDFYIDDSPYLAKEVLSHRNNFLFIVDTPHNREVKDSENLKRVRNVDDALQRLVQMAVSGLEHK